MEYPSCDEGSPRLFITKLLQKWHNWAGIIPARSWAFAIVKGILLEGFLGKIADCLHLYHAFDSRRICSINLSKGRNLKRKQTVHPANFHSKRHSDSGPFHPSNLKFRVASRCTRSRIREPFLCNNRLNYAGVRAFPLSADFPKASEVRERHPAWIRSKGAPFETISNGDIFFVRAVSHFNNKFRDIDSADFNCQHVLCFFVP